LEDPPTEKLDSAAEFMRVEGIARDFLAFDPQLGAIRFQLVPKL
jgi:hypothetical protein